MDRRARLALCGSLLAVTALGLCALAALRWGPAHQLDASALTGFVALRSPRLRSVCETVAHLGDPAPYAAAGAALIVVALVRGRQRTAFAIGALVAISPLTTEVLQPLLAVGRVDPALGAGQIGPASFPSGHATAAMTVGLCLVLATPAAWRPLAATVGAALAVAVSYALLALGWHYPSDVLGGYLVATGWTLLAVALLRMGPHRLRSQRPPVRRAVALAPAGAAALAAGVVGAVLAVRPGAVIFAQQHKTAIAAAGGMGAAAFALAAGLALELRR